MEPGSVKTDSQIVVVGIGTTDSFLMSDYFEPPRRDPHHPQQLIECFRLGAKIELSRVVHTVGGGAVNAATALARLGLRSIVVSCLGSDRGRIEILGHLKREGIPWEGVIRPDKPTPESYLILTKTGERTVLVHRGAGAELTYNDVATQLHKGAILYYALHPFEPKISRKILYGAKQRGMFVVWLPGNAELGVQRLFGKIAEEVDLVVLNREEAARVAGVEGTNWQRIKTFFERLSTPRVVITDGARGATVIGLEGVLQGKAPRVRAVDSTGAGDSFAASFLAGLLVHGSEQEALRWAILNSTSVVQQIGATNGLLRAIGKKSVTIEVERGV